MPTVMKPHMIRVEDHEGDGTCGECGREGVRWIVVISDGSRVGIECAKKVMGWKPAPRDYRWVSDYTLIAERDDGGDTMGLWQHKQDGWTVETLNGRLHMIGAARAEWVRRGWL